MSHQKGGELGAGPYLALVLRGMDRPMPGERQRGRL